jgi:hypothetical protein
MPSRGWKAAAIFSFSVHPLAKKFQQKNFATPRISSGRHVRDSRTSSEN